MNAIFIGGVNFSLKALERIVNLGVEISGVLTKKETGINADYVSLAPFCNEQGIPAQVFQSWQFGRGHEVADFSQSGHWFLSWLVPSFKKGSS